MIIYATKKMVEQYKLKMPNELSPSMKNEVDKIIEKESGDRIYEWGAKSFYFERKKCIQISNFASKFTLVLFDIKVSQIEDIGGMITHYLYELYSEDKLMLEALENYFIDSQIICFSKLTDRSSISTLNGTEAVFLDYGNRFYDYISNGILQTVELNRDINFNYLFGFKSDKKSEYDYYYSGEKFRELLVGKYKN